MQEKSSERIHCRIPICGGYEDAYVGPESMLDKVVDSSDSLRTGVVPNSRKDMTDPLVVPQYHKQHLKTLPAWGTSLECSRIGSKEMLKCCFEAQSRIGTFVLFAEFFWGIWAVSSGKISAMVSASKVGGSEDV